MKNILIIGNGIAGITAARTIRKQCEACKITVVSSETAHHFSRTALMYIYMGQMRYEDTQPYEAGFWQKNRIDLVFGSVTAIDFVAKECHFEKNTLPPCTYDALILATGSQPAFQGWTGQTLAGVQGLYAYQDLQKLEENTTIAGKKIKNAVIVGGGLIGVELAEMLHSRGIAVSVVLRENAYWSTVLPAEESHLIARHLEKHGINLIKNAHLTALLDENGDGRVDTIAYNRGGEALCLATDFVGITTGVQPNIAFLAPYHSELQQKRGILVDEYLKTSIDDVYAIGDCAELRNPSENRRAIEAIWYTGRMMGETVAHTILGKPTKYLPRLWFNSAKFFDIEYQIYGHVPPEISGNLASLYWQHSDGEKAIRIVYHVENETVVGFNTLGIRYRQEVCEKWILEQTPLETVLQNLSLANFDPEFYKEYESELLSVYTEKTGRKVTLQQKRRLDSVLDFLRK